MTSPVRNRLGSLWVIPEGTVRAIGNPERWRSLALRRAGPSEAYQRFLYALVERPVLGPPTTTLDEIEPVYMSASLKRPADLGQRGPPLHPEDQFSASISSRVPNCEDFTLKAGAEARPLLDVPPLLMIEGPTDRLHIRRTQPHPPLAERGEYAADPRTTVTRCSRARCRACPSQRGYA